MTDDEKALWLEGAEEFGSPLEDWNKVPVVSEDDIDETMSIPGVQYSSDPSVNTSAKPDGFIQLHLGSLFSRINDMEDSVEEAATAANTAATNADTATTNANTATSAANTATSNANTATTNANSAASSATTQASYAKAQGDYAKNMADHPPYVGADDYWYIWNYSSQAYVKSNYAKGDDLDYSTMTTAEKAELSATVAEEVAAQGGYAIIAIEESDLSTTMTIRKHSIICIDGVVYMSNAETSELPFVFVAYETKFMTQTLYGHTCYVRDSTTLNSNWDVWIDASNDVRFKSLEARVANLETIVSSL